ncbi:hypothetical protein Nepgr_013902 [Nepenthes gracilis]|uniref:Uncharacterized protein n=1 Tax=Nepenthes gracilis TaxID=150966 RepID=A0AAD3XPT4_NEPGR|nr:hypothetical protein Nepgr_013902 [Nepenthes gracilis]
MVKEYAFRSNHDVSIKNAGFPSTILTTKRVQPPQPTNINQACTGAGELPTPGLVGLFVGGTAVVTAGGGGGGVTAAGGGGGGVTAAGGGDDGVTAAGD